jgi:hypothetical protein
MTQNIILTVQSLNMIYENYTYIQAMREILRTRIDNNCGYDCFSSESSLFRAGSTTFDFIANGVKQSPSPAMTGQIMRSWSGIEPPSATRTKVYTMMSANAPTQAAGVMFLQCLADNGLIHMRHIATSILPQNTTSVESQITTMKRL